MKPKIKVCLFLFFLVSTTIGCLKTFNASYNIDRQIGRFIAYSSGDTDSYTQDMERLVSTGHYYASSSEVKEVGRGPYYAVPYYVFRQFLPVDLSFDLVALVQIFIFCIALVVFFTILDNLVKNKWILLGIFILYLVRPYSLGDANRIYTESLTVSYLIFFTYFYINFNQTSKKSSLFLSAIFLALISVMKPYYLIVYSILFVDYVFFVKANYKKAFRFVLFMSIPLVVICLPFTIFNLKEKRIFAPMQNTTYAGSQPDSAFSAIRSLVREWGEDYISWDNNALGTYFYPIPGFQYAHAFPERLLTPDYSLSDIQQLKKDYAKYELANNPNEKRILRHKIITNSLLIKESWRKHHPFSVITSRIKVIKYLVFQGGFSINHRHSGLRHIVSNLLCFIQWSSYYIFLIFGLLGFSYFLKLNKNYRFILFIMFYIVIFFSILRAGESRFFSPMVFYLIIGTAYFLDYIVSYLRTHKVCQQQ